MAVAKGIQNMSKSRQGVGYVSHKFLSTLFYVIIGGRYWSDLLIPFSGFIVSIFLLKEIKINSKELTCANPLKITSLAMVQK